MVRLDPQECGRRLAERIAGHPLRFAPGSTALAADFYPILDAVAALARDCPSERIEIVGHLDAPNAKPPEPDPIATDAARESAPKPKPAPPKKAAKDDKKASKAEAKPAAPEKPEPVRPRPARTSPARGRWPWSITCRKRGCPSTAPPPRRAPRL